MNLFHCLNELHDQSLVEEIQKALNSGQMFANMSPAQWSGVGFLLLSSDSELKHFDLKKYCASEEVLERLLMVVKASRKAVLSYCNLSLWSCKRLSAVMSSSSLTHLDLSNNDLRDAGVQLLCSGLRGAPCRLENLRLSGCLVSEEGGFSLASALSSVHSRLKELDLSYNHPGASAERLIALLDEPHCPLCALWLEPFGHKWLIPGLTKYFCKLSLDLDTANRKLRLSGNCSTVRYDHKEQPYPDHQSRFISCPQILCSSPLKERSYWELEWELHNNGSIYIAVSYSRISREGNRKACGFGRNQHSWALRISRKSYSVYHDNNVTVLPHTPQNSQSSRSSRYIRSGPSLPCFVAVYLDYKAGFLSFYEVASTRRIHLHTFHATFTDFLYAGFRLRDSSVYLMDTGK
ncbi:hypothetical protein NL108_015518 [Boleophthalmus pectinirostris]|nr:hypothetical protein NL108_015518 [Boleophthalmus pectinirostris]